MMIVSAIFSDLTKLSPKDDTTVVTRWVLLFLTSKFTLTCKIGEVGSLKQRSLLLDLKTNLHFRLFYSLQTV